MKQEEKEQINETYNDYVESVTPKANLWLRMAKAFLVGGLICLLGQCIINIGKKYGLDDQTAASYCSLSDRRTGDPVWDFFVLDPWFNLLVYDDTWYVIEKIP